MNDLILSKRQDAKKIEDRAKRFQQIIRGFNEAVEAQVAPSVGPSDYRWDRAMEKYLVELQMSAVSAEIRVAAKWYSWQLWPVYETEIPEGAMY